MFEELRQLFISNIQLLLPGDHASLVLGVILGENNFSDGFELALKTTGLVHVVVVSGYNISVVGQLTLSLFRFLSKRLRILAGILSIIFYILLAGPTPPTIRAGIMGTIALSSTVFGRENYALYSLGLAAVVMILVDPSILGSISFQLSFVATLGIIVFEKHFHKVLNLPYLGPFRSDLSTSLAAQVLVVPIILYNFGSVSIISPVSNMFSLWTIPLITYLGFLLALVSLISLPLASIVAWITYLFTSIFMFLVALFDQVPFAAVQLDRKNLVVSVAFSFIILGVAFAVRQLNLTRLQIAEKTAVQIGKDAS